MAGNTNTAQTLNWGEALKIEVGDLTPKEGAGNKGGDRTPLPPLPEGKYAAFTVEAKPRTNITETAYKTGAQGGAIMYAISEGEHKNRKISENLVVQKGDGTFSITGQRIFKSRLMAFGLPPEKVNAFKGPKSKYDLGDFALLGGKPVTIYVKPDGVYEGRQRSKVVAVYLRTVSE